jgi:IS1 family transposase
VEKKKNKVWLIYAYHRKSGEIVAYVWGKRDIKTAYRLRQRIQEMGISCERIAADNRESFVSAFAGGYTRCGEEVHSGDRTEGGQLPDESDISQDLGFSKKLFNHWKAVDMAFFYINYGFV